MVESTDKPQPEKAVTAAKASTTPTSTEKASTEESVTGTSATATTATATTAIETTKTTVDPSAARKRRKAIIESQRKESEEAAQKESEQEAKQKGKPSAGSADDNDDESGDESDNNNEDESANGTPSNGRKRKSKRTQIRYDPDVPMSKEQLAAWRREARRVRNRESAAASRQRIRNRITELETEVDDYKSKYHAALDRLKELEELAKAKRQRGNADKETTGETKEGGTEAGKA